MKNIIKVGYVILIIPVVIWEARDIIRYYLSNNIILGDPGRKLKK